MLKRSLDDVSKTKYFVHWGNGTSHRLLTVEDNMGFTICYTVVDAGTESLLCYNNHAEACYCIDGHGEIEDMNGVVYPINPGDLYALDKGDQHYLRASKDQNLILMSVFNPALNGDEVHNINNFQASSY